MENEWLDYLTSAFSVKHTEEILWKPDVGRAATRRQRIADFVHPYLQLWRLKNYIKEILAKKIGECHNALVHLQVKR